MTTRGRQTPECTHMESGGHVPQKLVAPGWPQQRDAKRQRRRRVAGGLQVPPARRRAGFRVYERFGAVHCGACPGGMPCQRRTLEGGSQTSCAHPQACFTRSSVLRTCIRLVAPGWKLKAGHIGGGPASQRGAHLAGRRWARRRRTC